MHVLPLKDKYSQEAVPRIMKEKGLRSALAVPHIEKVVINVGTGKIRDKKDFVEEVIRHLALIAGQKPSPRQARKSVASFKTRTGMIVGYAVTLRGKRMYDFLDRLIHIAIPRMRDFRGIPLRSIDQKGNLTFGVKEHIVFPEMIGENIKTIFGFEITVTTNAKKKEDAIALYRLLGFPIERL